MSCIIFIFTSNINKKDYFLFHKPHTTVTPTDYALFQIRRSIGHRSKPNLALRQACQLFMFIQITTFLLSCSTLLVTPTESKHSF